MQFSFFLKYFFKFLVLQKMVQDRCAGMIIGLIDYKVFIARIGVLLQLVSTCTTCIVSILYYNLTKYDWLYYKINIY